MIVSIVFISITIVLVALVLSMPQFFTRMPRYSTWFEKGSYRIIVYMGLFHKEDVPIQKVVNTWHIVAYLKLRLLALYQDVKTTGSNWDVYWDYKKLDEA